MWPCFERNVMWTWAHCAKLDIVHSAWVSMSQRMSLHMLCMITLGYHAEASQLNNHRYVQSVLLFFSKGKIDVMSVTSGCMRSIQSVCLDVHGNGHWATAHSHCI